MKLSVLRARFAPPFDVDAFIRLNHSLRPDSVWHAGEVHRQRGTLRNSGFSLSLAEESDWPTLLDQTCKQLASLKQPLERAVEVGAEIEVDFGLSVGGAGAFTSSAAFDPKALRFFSELGVRVRVSAYPSSDGSEPEIPDAENSQQSTNLGKPDSR